MVSPSATPCPISHQEVQGRLLRAAMSLNEIGIKLIEDMDLEVSQAAFEYAIRAFRKLCGGHAVQEQDCLVAEALLRRAEQRLSVGDILEMHPFQVQVLPFGTTPRALEVLQEGPSELIIAPLHLSTNSWNQAFPSELDRSLATVLYNQSIACVCMARLSANP